MSLPTQIPISGFGGYITIQNIQQAPVQINVGNWTLYDNLINEELAHSSTLGAICRRRIALDWKADITLWWCIDQKVEAYLRTGWGFAVRLNLGTGDSYYYSPSALMGTSIITNDSAGDIVRRKVTIEGNSLLFLLPDQLSEWTDYYKILKPGGEVW